MFEDLIDRLRDGGVPIPDDQLALEVTLDLRGDVVQLGQLIERVADLRARFGLDDGRIELPFAQVVALALSGDAGAAGLPVPLDWLMPGQVRDLALAQLQSVDDDWEHLCIGGPPVGRGEMADEVERGTRAGERYVLSVLHHCTFLHEAACAGVLRPPDGGLERFRLRVGDDAGGGGAFVQREARAGM